MLRENFQGRRENRQAEAKVRQEKYSALSPAEKLAKLPAVGASRQRLKLLGLKLHGSAIVKL